MRFFPKKQEFDAKRLEVAVNNLQKMRHRWASDPWSFVGAVFLMYHTFKFSAKETGELPILEQFEQNVLEIATLKSNESKETTFRFGKLRDLPYIS